MPWKNFPIFPLKRALFMWQAIKAFGILELIDLKGLGWA
jgi:hypothetical protein